MLKLLKSCLPVVILLSVTAFGLPTDAGPATEISVNGTGGIAIPGGRAGYTLTFANAGSGPAAVAASLTLPDGFDYQSGSSTLRLDGRAISIAGPAINGQKLSRPAFDLPGAAYRSTSRFGIHTMVQDLCLESYVDFQLDKALALTGEGAYIKQTFYSLKPGTSGPQACWAYFVNGAYKRHLTPIIRLQVEYDGSKGYWIKPRADPGGGYATIAGAYRRVVEGLPRRAGQPLYVEIWNEPELPVSWSNAPSAAEYGRFFVDVAGALHAIGDSRIRVLNGALTPGNAAFAEQLLRVPGFGSGFDLWAAHCYPYNHPPQYNLHAGTARYPEYTIDSYRLELGVLARYGRGDVKVILTETGYGLGDDIFAFEGYPAINETNRADFMSRAFRDYWPRWPELLAACPFELVGPYGDWEWLDWLHPTTDIPHAQYTAIAALPKPPLLYEPMTATITFQTRVAAAPGVYESTLEATADGVPLTPASPTVRIIDVVSRLLFPLILKSGATQGSAPSVVGESSATAALTYTILAPPQASRQAADVAGGLRSRRILLKGAALAVAVDDTGERAFVSRSGAQFDVLRLETGAIELTLPLPVDLDLLAYDPTGRLYGIRIGDDRLFAVDLGSGRTGETAVPLRGPVGIAVDPGTGKVFVACAGDNSVTVLDRSLRLTARALLPGGPLLGLALDPATGRVYVTQPLVPGRHGIVVLDEDRLQPLAALGGGYEQPLAGLYGVAVSAGSGRLVAPDRKVLWWVDPDQHALVHAWQAEEVVPRGGVVFTPDGKRLLVLVGASLQIVEADR
jgi:DNA-binding beta-propeller fold protein YncE